MGWGWDGGSTAWKGEGEVVAVPRPRDLPAPFLFAKNYSFFEPSNYLVFVLLLPLTLYLIPSFRAGWKWRIVLITSFLWLLFSRFDFLCLHVLRDVVRFWLIRFIRV